MPDTTESTDRVAACLAEIQRSDTAGIKGHPWVESVPRLAAAVERVLELADGAYVMLANCETGPREPVAWDLDPEAVRKVIAKELLGEDGDSG